MRGWIVLVGALAGCGPKTEVENARPASPTASQAPSDSGGKSEAPVVPSQAQPSRATGALAVDHVDLLEAADVVAQRTDADTLAALLKPIMSTIIAYDRALPDEVDAFVAARTGATRVWLASATGDLSLPELEREIAKIPPVTIRSGTVAVVIRFVRAGATASPHTKWFLPASWKAAAGPGTPVDDVIERVWPVR